LIDLAIGHTPLWSLRISPASDGIDVKMVQGGELNVRMVQVGDLNQLSGLLVAASSRKHEPTEGLNQLSGLLGCWFKSET
jgi:hypothetical protein